MARFIGCNLPQTLACLAAKSGPARQKIEDHGGRFLAASQNIDKIAQSGSRLRRQADRVKGRPFRVIPLSPRKAKTGLRETHVHRAGSLARRSQLRSPSSIRV